MSAPLEVARAAWGTDLPDWIEALAVECGASSQSRVAARMGCSAAVISTVLRRKYPANMAGIEERFRGAIQDVRVECPALGPIPANLCQDWRRKARTFASGNPLRIRMFQACSHCPKNAVEAQKT